jgi:hypothetical protein
MADVRGARDQPHHGQARKPGWWQKQAHGRCDPMALGGERGTGGERKRMRRKDKVGSTRPTSNKCYRVMVGQMIYRTCCILCRYCYRELFAISITSALRFLLSPDIRVAWEVEKTCNNNKVTIF